MQMYPLDRALSSEDSNTKINGKDTYFLALNVGSEIIINGEKRTISTVLSDIAFTLTVGLSSAVTEGDFIYTEDKCAYLEYKIWEIQTAIDNVDYNSLGMKRVESGSEEFEFMEKNTTLDQLLARKKTLEIELDKCKRDKSGDERWMIRRAETGTY